MAVRYATTEPGEPGYPVNELRWNPEADTLDVWRIGDYGYEYLKARIPYSALSTLTGTLFKGLAENEIVVKVSPEIKDKLLTGTLELRGDHQLYYDEEKRVLWFTHLEARDAN